MNVMILSTALTGTPAVVPADSITDTLFCGIAACALGRLLIAHSAKDVCAILIGDTRKELEADLAARFPGAKLVANETMVHDDLAKVIRFWKSLPRGFISNSIGAGPRSSAVSGRSFARFPSVGR